MEYGSFYENSITFVAETINITETEARRLFSPGWHVSTAADVKTALEQAIRANMLLSAMKANLSGYMKRIALDMDEQVANILDLLNKYKGELSDGKFPIHETDQIMEDYNAYIAWVESFGDKPVTQKDLKDQRPVWTLFYKSGVNKTTPPRFTTVDITKITSEEITADTTQRAILDIAKRVAQRNIQVRRQEMEVKNEVISELLDGVRKTISALGSAAQIISAELYGINRSEAISRYTGAQNQ